VYQGIQENAPKPPAVIPPGENRPSYPGTLLRTGSRGEDVRTMQNFLNVIGSTYPTIPRLNADGVFGPATQSAVTAFQRLMGLTPDGIIGPATWNRIVDAYFLVIGNPGTSKPFPGTPLRVGSRGDNVRFIQNALNSLRSAYPSLPAVSADGIFGPQTEAAVIAFQRMFGLTPDGIIGPVTWNAIMEQVNRL